MRDKFTYVFYFSFLNTSTELLLRRRNDPPSGWSSHTHPEGLLYHRGKIDDFTFSTDADVCDKFVAYRVRTAAQTLIEKLTIFYEGDTSGIEIVLDAVDTKGTSWEYYIVDHKSKHLFWLDIHVVETYIYKGAESEAHVGERFYLIRVQ